MARFAYPAVLGLVGALLVHLLIVFMMPAVMGGRAHSALTAADEGPGKPLVIGVDLAQGLGFRSFDPLFRVRVCPFDLADGSFAVRSNGGVPFFSAAVVDQTDTVAFSLTDRLSFERRIDMEILPRSEERRYRLREEAGGQTQSDTLPVFVDTPAGHVVIRAFIPDASFSAMVDDFLAGIQCETLAPAEE